MALFVQTPLLARLGRIAFLALGVSCASQQAVHRPPQPPPVAPRAAPEPPRPKATDDDEMQVWGSGVQGTLSETQVAGPLDMHANEFVRCKEQTRPKSPRYVGGKVMLGLRIGLDGTVQRAFVKESTLGNLALERCLVRVALTVVFPRPKGGHVEVEYSIELPAQSPVRNWDSDVVSGEFVRRKDDLEICNDGVARQPPHKITLYVGPGGAVTSLGLSSAEPMGEGYVDCLLAKVRMFRFPDPKGVAARASYSR